MDEEKYSQIFELKTTLNSIEHMVYVSCKFTRTTEMIYETIKHIVKAGVELANLILRVDRIIASKSPT